MNLFSHVTVAVKPDDGNGIEGHPHELAFKQICEAHPNNIKCVQIDYEQKIPETEEWIEWHGHHGEKKFVAVVLFCTSSNMTDKYLSDLIGAFNNLTETIILVDKFRTGTDELS